MRPQATSHWARWGAIVVASLAFVAAASMALHSASQPIVGVAQCLLALVAVVAATAVVCFSGARRALAVGALIGGASYYVLATDAMQWPLETTGLLSDLHDRVVREVPNPHAASASSRGGGTRFGGGGGGFGRFPTSPTIPFPYKRDFIAVGECLWTLAFSLFGGGVAGWFAVRREAENQPPAKRESR